MKSIALLFLSLLCVSAITVAAPRPDEETVQKALAQHNAQAAEPDKVVCKRVRQTGTHFKRRVCFKRAEWDRMREDAQQGLRWHSDRILLTPPDSG